MPRPAARALGLVVTVAALVLVWTSFASGGRASPAAAGPCLPAGVTLPPGAPHLPPCKKTKPKPKAKTVRLDVSVSGGMTLADASHQGDRASCGANSGGGSTTSGTTEINFGQDGFDARRAPIDSTGHITGFSDQPIVQVTYNPSGQSQHWFPPDCAPQPDPVACSQKTEGDTVRLTGTFNRKRTVPHNVTITLSPSTVLGAGPSRCPAPFFDGWSLVGSRGTITFKYELDSIDDAGLSLLLGPKHKKGHSTLTLNWDVPKDSCSKFGGPTTPSVQAGGTLDSCTVEADFRLVLKRVD